MRSKSRLGAIVHNDRAAERGEDAERLGVLRER
jgi:hypothetical protein